MYAYEAHQPKHKHKDRLSPNMIFKRSLQFTPGWHLALDRSSSSSSSESSGVRRVAQAPIKAISYYNSSHTPRELQAAAARALDCCWAADRSAVLCAKIGKCVYVYPLRAEKRGLRPNLTGVHGDRRCRSPIHGDVAETRGFALSVPKAKEGYKACHARHTAPIAPKLPAT